MENPILAMIPSGYNAADAKLYSILPVDGSGDFTVSVDADATRVNKEGLIEGVALNQARLTYDPLNPECPSLLLEPTVTNQLSYSQDFSNSYWNKQGGSSVTSNTIISPDGRLTADTLSGAIGTDVSGSVLRLNTYWINSEATLSIYCKSLGSNNLTAYIRSGADGSVTSQSISLSSEWQRVDVTKNPATGQIFFGNTNGDVAIWGAQMEEGSYATSYVPTTSTQVTRTRDICKDAGNAALFNVSKLSLFIDVNNFKTNTGSFSYIVLTDGQNSPINMIRLDYTQNSISIRSYDNGTIKLSYNITSVVPNQRNKLLLTFDNNEAKTYFNGVLKNTSTSITIPSGLDSLSFTNRTESGGYFQGEVHDARVYDRVLTETEAIKLTT